jgi:hypothetical protein
MQQQAGQFTPEQLIVAGRRAEAQGQGNYALQFYRYIADQYPSTTEAYEARDALYRLTQTPGPEMAVTAHTPQHVAADGRHPTSLDVGHGPSHGQALGQAPPGGSARKTSKNRKPRVSAPEAETGAAGPGYRIGRLVAAMLGTMGWLLFLSGLLTGPVVLAALSVKSMPKGLKEAIAGNLLMVGAGTFGALFLGLMAIFAAQVARASFDTADAVRALLDAGNQDGSSR